jgi:very-short-patch-repair endonuclease
VNRRTSSFGANTRDARRMRKRPTAAEMKLWSCLRHRQLDGGKFRRQVVVGPYIVDFACLSRKLVVEVDGAQHGESATDAVRTAWLESQGYRVLRLWNSDGLLRTEDVVRTIFGAIEDQG